MLQVPRLGISNRSTILALVAFCLLGFLTFNLQVDFERRTVVLRSPFLDSGRTGVNPPPRISIVAIWSGDIKPYLNNFLTSMRANADTTELIWIAVTDEQHPNCPDISAWIGPPKVSNIKAVCLSKKKYWRLHRDYFCKRWKCTKQEAKDVLQTMMDRHYDDPLKSAFRIYRGYIFRHLMDPGVEWWGWADPDTFIGSLRSQFPWDAAEFDVLIPSQPSNLLHMRGHLCFLRTGPKTEERMHEFETLTSAQTYLNRHTPHFAAEEVEYSAFILRNQNITFVMFSHHLVELDHDMMLANTAKFSSLHGVYTMQLPLDVPSLPAPFPHFPVLNVPTTFSSPLPTFSDRGKTYPIELIYGKWPNDLWFPQDMATWYDIEWNRGGPGTRRYVGRGGALEGGSQGVWERIEPPVPTIEVQSRYNRNVRVSLREGLYAHFFEEKYNGDWFKDLPTAPLGRDEALVTFFKHGAEIWNLQTGEVVWRRGGDPPPLAKDKKPHGKNPHAHR